MPVTARWTVLAAALVLLGPGAAWGQPVFTASQDPLAGAQVFGAKGCSKCHSVNGVGGKVGPDLAKISRPHTFYDLAADMWNHLQKMTGKMKELGITRPRLDSREAADLVGFLFTLNYFDAPGNAEVGKKIFTEKKCVVCHTYQNAGGVVGPNLDHFTQFRSPIYVASAMWNHGPQMAEKMKEKGIERPTFTGTELRDLIAYLAPATAGPQEGPVYALPGRPEAGRQLFAEKRCIECHAVGGVGGKVGPDLVQRGVRQSPIEFATTIWNKAPAMAEAMKTRGIALPQLTPAEMADIVAYLYSVRYFGTAGSIQAGWAVATQKGCLACHAVRGERGKPASDVTKWKGLDSPAAVLAALWNHTIVTPPSVGGKKAEWPLCKPQEMADLIALLQSVGSKQPPKPS
ncbi:MAG TPA: c-type cytochrome [Candidatus Methylomirabilis sp.]|nr:c-type cytochrome [Candidatus Methylomirabilis sp.]